MIPAVAAAAALLVAGFTHQAAPHNRLNVALNGRSLAAEDGARSYYRDLAKAAIKVCDRRPAKGDLWALDRFDACVKSTLGGAVAETRAPLVTALYARSQGDAQYASR